MGTRVTQNAVEKLAESLEDKTEAYVVIQGEGALGARTRLRQWLELAAEPAADRVEYDDQDEASDLEEADDES